MAIDIVQSATGSGSGSGHFTVTVNLPVAPTAGNLLVALTTGGLNIDGWNIRSQTDYAPNGNISDRIVANGESSSIVFPVDANAVNGNQVAMVLELSGADIFDTAATTGINESGYHPSMSFNSFTSSSSGSDFSIAFCAMNGRQFGNPNNPVWDNGFTNVGALSDGLRVFGFVATKTIPPSTSVGTTNLSWTGNVFSTYSLMVGYKVAVLATPVDTSPKTLVFNDLSLAEKTDSLVWVDQNALLTALSVPWTDFQAVGVSSSLLWDSLVTVVLTALDGSRLLAWDVRSLVGDSRKSEWSDLIFAVADASLFWRVLRIIDLTGPTEFLVLTSSKGTLLLREEKTELLLASENVTLIREHTEL